MADTPGESTESEFIVMTAGIRGVFHTGVTVSNLDTSIPFYRDILGLRLVLGPTPPSGGEDFSRAVGVPGAMLRLAVFDTGGGELELLEYMTPPSPIREPVPPNALGAGHVAFRVEGIDDKVSELADKGVKFLSRVQSIDEGPLKGWRWIYFKDPDGITMELIEVDDHTEKS